MVTCGAGCVPAEIPKVVGAACRIVTKPAGFDRVIFKKCDYEFASITDLAEWTAALTSGDIASTGRVLGQKPKGSPTKRRVASCLPERTTNYTRSWQWKDSNSDPTNLTEYDFYSFVDEYQDVLNIAFLTCDGLLYGFYSDYSLDVDDTRSEPNDEDAVIECTAEIKSRLITKPIKLPGLAAVLATA